MRRFRSLLYAPGDRPDLIEAAVASVADAVILDLEDRVAADRKDVARAAARSWIARVGAERIVYVRVNPLDSGLLEADLAAIAVPGLAGVRVPKVESVGDVRALDRALDRAEVAGGLEPGSVSISLGLESALAVRRTYDLCTASRRVGSVAPGLGRGGDLQSDVGYVWTEDGTETLHIRSAVVLDARAAGVPIPLDGGWGTYHAYEPARDEAAFLRSATAGRQLGYRAKICFHAAQAEHINRIFEYAEGPHS